MKPTTNERRLRKYLKKKRRNINRYGVFYWRYHFKVYGPHVQYWNLTGEPNA